jgi:hypothetical protein
MSARKTDVLKNWLIVITAMFSLSPTVIFLTFSQSSGLSNQQKIENRTQALSTTATLFLGLALMIHAYVAAKGVEASQKSAMAAEKSNEIETKNALLGQEQLVAERFMTAITQLGHESVATRTGAIYALERVAQDSPKEYWTIMEILTAFVRENAASQSQEEETPETPARIRTDIQAALSVIARRDAQKDQPNQRIDLRYANMRGADLHKANLQQADLRGSDLCEADPTRSRLE